MSPPRPPEMGTGAKLCHVVVYRLEEGLDPDRVGRVEAQFEGLGNEIAEILSIEAGRNVSSSRLARGWDFGAVMTFAGTAEQDRFLAHPAHDRLTAATADGFFREAMVFDLPIAGANATGRG